MTTLHIFSNILKIALADCTHIRQCRTIENRNLKLSAYTRTPTAPLTRDNYCSQFGTYLSRTRYRYKYVCIYA